MPAKSKDQQRAAAIALKAKRDGEVDDLPSGAAKNMAKSMSEKELDKLASTKHKGLPEDKPNENKAWAGESLLETFFSEEMIGTDEEGEAITSDKPTKDQVEDAGRDKEDDTGWDGYDDTWDSKVHTDAPMGQTGRPMGSNVTGAARVSFESLERMPSKELDLDKDEMKCPDCYGTGYHGGHGDTMSWRDAPKRCDRCNGKGKVKKKVSKEHRDPNSLDILFEQQNDEYYMADEYYDLTHSSDWDEDDMDDPHGIARSEIDYDKLENFEETLKGRVKDGLDWTLSRQQHYVTGDKQEPTLEFAVEIAEDELGDLPEFGKEAEMLYDAYGDEVDEKWQQHPAFASRVFSIAAKKLGKEAWEEWAKKRGDLDEQALGGLESDDWTEDWGPGIEADPDFAVDPEDNDIDFRMHSSLIDDMAEHVITHNDLHGRSPDDWDPAELLADFEYDYSVSVANPEDISAAEEAIRRAKEELGDSDELRFESKRWQKLAGVKLLNEERHLNELDSAQADRYVRRMAKHEWEWLDVAAKLQDQYGLTLSDIERLKPAFEEESERLKNEAMLGGVSNGGPAPGHRAKMNEDSDLELLKKGKAHRVDVFGVRDDLAGLAYEVAGEIQGMHLDTSDRRTEKMIQNKMEKMYRFLLKLKNLAN